MRSERKEKRYIRMLLEYLDKEKFENMPVCSQEFHEDEYGDLADSFEQVEMTRAIGDMVLCQDRVRLINSILRKNIIEGYANVYSTNRIDVASSKRACFAHYMGC